MCALYDVVVHTDVPACYFSVVTVVAAVKPFPPHEIPGGVKVINEDPRINIQI